MRFYTFYTVILDFFVSSTIKRFPIFHWIKTNLFWLQLTFFLTIDQEAIHGFKEDFK